jgi:S1-C subfamily serine protease
LLSLALGDTIVAMNFRKTGSSSVLLLLLICSFASTASAQVAKRTQQKPALTTSEIAARVKRSLLLITTQDSKGNVVAQGSGFFIGPDYVITNLHVLKRASDASVKSLSDGITYKVDDVLEFSLTHDLCMLLVPNAKGVPLPINTTGPAVGDEILVAGNPEGLEATFSKGIISAIRKERGLLQIDAPISPGSSGGPVVNMRGEVIGVAVSSLVEGQNLNFAVPIGFLGGGPSIGFKNDIWVLGRLSVPSLENEGTHGPVKRFDERKAKYSYSGASDAYIEGPAELSSGLAFNREGRLQERDYYMEGVANGKDIT